LSSGPVHRRISRIIAAPAAVAAGLISGDWYAAVVIGVACALSGCGPDEADQAEARLSAWEKVVAGAAWLAGGAWMVWELRNAPGR